MRMVQPTYNTNVVSTTATTCHENALYSKKQTSASSTIVGTKVKTTALNTMVMDRVPLSMIRCNAPVLLSKWNERSRFSTWLNTCNATLRPAACATCKRTTHDVSLVAHTAELK